MVIVFLGVRRAQTVTIILHTSPQKTVLCGNSVSVAYYFYCLWVNNVSSVLFECSY